MILGEDTKHVLNNTESTSLCTGGSYKTPSHGIRLLGTSRVALRGSRIVQQGPRGVWRAPGEAGNLEIVALGAEM